MNCNRLKPIILVLVALLLIGLPSCSNNNNLNNTTVNTNVGDTKESYKVTRLTNEEKEYMKSFIPSKYLDNPYCSFDADFRNSNGTNNVLIHIQDESFDNLDNCISFYKEFIKKLIDSELYKKVNDCSINYMGTKDYLLTHMVWIDSLYNININDYFSNIKTKSFKSNGDDTQKNSNSQPKLSNDEIKSLLEEWFNVATEKNTLVKITESSDISGTDWIVSLYSENYINMAECQLEFSILMQSLRQNNKLWNNIENMQIGFTDGKTFACGAIMDVPAIKRNDGRYAEHTEWQDWTWQLK